MSYIFFIVLSAFEGIAIFTATLSIYRFRIQKYLWQVSTISVLQALISHFLRNEQEFSEFVPIISLGLIIFLLYVFVVNSFFWSVVMAVTGFVYHSLFQTIIIFTLEWSGIATLESIQSNTVDSYIGLITSSLVTIATSLFLYHKGLGLSFDFDRFRFKGENGIIMTIITAALLSLVYICVRNDLNTAAIAFGVCLIFLLFFLIKKEFKR
jgi:hypothetical protein